jgi:hypothetical protein
MTHQQVLSSAATLELPPVTTPIPAVEQLLADVVAGRAGATSNLYAGADPPLVSGANGCVATSRPAGPRRWR